MSERRSRGFALVALALAGAATFTAREAAAQAANEAAAQMRFQRGRDLFVANDFNGALTEFRAANQLVGSPNTRLYIARCLRGLNRLGDAYIEFQRAAAEAADRSVNEPRYAASRATPRGKRWTPSARRSETSPCTRAARARGARGARGGEWSFRRRCSMCRSRRRQGPSK
jgi:tetratricopeptide (TPR) repeat protein